MTLLSSASLEQCARQDGPIHRLDPALKIILLLIFECCVISCTPEKITLLPAYLAALFVPGCLAKISAGLFFRRLAVALPFAFFTGIWGCLYDRMPVSLCGIDITHGFLAFLSIMFRTALCVGCVLIFAGTTRISKMAEGMRRLHVPQEIVSIFELMWRYLSVIVDEAQNVWTAWKLRNGQSKGVSVKYLGSFLGGIFIRSVDRAQQIHAAMTCRGYPAARQNRHTKPSSAEYAGTFCFAAACIAYRILA
ncbi:MAG: cobalt ECF transporter T component CbiQ [Proteobacteria bacterium]|nr:cobalt ECF transporter T component CbiQ [Pseudomonadota bacterium]